MNSIRQQAGQASVEFALVAGLIAFAALAMAQLVLAGWTLVTAGEAARAGARAAHLGSEPEPASDRAVPAVLGNVIVNQDGGQVSVKLHAPPVIPGVPRIPVEATAELDPAGGGA